MDIAKLLPNIFLFESFSKDEFGKVLEFSSLVELASDEPLFSEGEEAKALFAVVLGKLKIYKVSIGGAEQILHIQKPFDLVAEASIFDKGTYPASCRALEETKVLRVEGDAFRNLILKDPKLALKLLRSYSQRLRGFVSLVDDLSLRDVKGRLANYLVKHWVKKGDGFVCELNISKRELASALGTVPETLSRTIKDFKDKGLIEEKGKAIFILDPKKIKSICE